jgi:hypothetical protein
MLLQLNRINLYCSHWKDEVNPQGYTDN